MCVDLGERLIRIIITVKKAYKDHHYCTKGLQRSSLLYNVLLYTHILILHAPTCISIVLLQTRDALKEEVSKHGLNIIHSASFPTDQDPQPFVQSLQVSNCNEITQCCCKLPYFHHTQESSGRIIFLNCYPKYAREILCQVCANCSMLAISETSVHVQVHVSLCVAGFHTGHGTTKLCMDHIRMVS